MNTTAIEPASSRRRRRKHSAEFKAQAVAACQEPGVSIAAMALANGINANLLRRWVVDAEQPPQSGLPAVAPIANAALSFIPVAMSETTCPPDIRIELRRGATSINVTCGLKRSLRSHVDECGNVMSDEVEELVGRLVVGRKRDGRKVFDEGVKAELVALCARSGTSVSKLARECDLNANQLSRWIREHEQGRQRAVVARPVATREAFVELPVVATTMRGSSEESSGAMSMQAWLPNGVVVEVRGVELRQTLEMFEALGRMRCSVLTKG